MVRPVDIDGLPRGTKRICKCGACDVSWTDHVERIGSLNFVHGLSHCFQWRAA